MVLEKTLESPLDCKEIQQIHPKGDQSWEFIGKTDVEAETPILWPPDAWMAPFMVIGSTVGRWLHLPQLHIEADNNDCISCGRCNKACPMGLDVKKMVAEGCNSKCTECIQCGACVDECPKKVLRYKMTWR